MATLTDKYTQAFSDKFLLGKSRVFVQPSDGYYGVIHLPRYAFVRAVYAQITTAWVGGTPSIEVGWVGNKETAVTNGFITNDVMKPKTAGMKMSVSDTLTSSAAKYFSAGSGAITLTVASGGATTVGTIVIFADYVVIY